MHSAKSSLQRFEVLFDAKSTLTYATRDQAEAVAAVTAGYNQATSHNRKVLVVLSNSKTRSKNGKAAAAISSRQHLLTYATILTITLSETHV